MKSGTKASLRDLYFNKTRSTIVILAIILIVAFPLAFLNVTPSLTNIIDTETEDYHLAHLQIIYSSYQNTTRTQQIQQLARERLGTSDVQVEGRLTVTTKVQGTERGSLHHWVENEAIAVDPHNLPQINQFKLISGHYATTKDEAVVLDSFATALELQKNDTLTIYGELGAVNYTIVGLMQSVEHSSFDLTNQGVVLVSFAGMNNLINATVQSYMTTRDLIYIAEKVSIEQLRDLSTYLQATINRENPVPTIVLIWYIRESSFRAGIIDGLKLTSKYLFVAVLFVFVVASIIIYLIINRSVNEQKKVLGALHSFGLTKRELITNYFIKILVLQLLGVLLGLAAAYYILFYLVNFIRSSWGLMTTNLAIDMFPSAIVLFTGALVVHFANFAALLNLLRLTPYEAMRGKTTELDNDNFLFKITDMVPTRLLRRAAKNLTRSKTRTFLTVLALIFSLTFTWSLVHTQQTIGGTIDIYYADRVNFDVDIGFDFQDSFDPIFLLNISQAKEVVAAEPYIYSAVSLSNRPEVLMFLMSYLRSSTMFDVTDTVLEAGRWFRENTSEIVISQYVAGTHGVAIGDTLHTTIHGFNITGKVVGINNELISTSSISMDFTYLSRAINPLQNNATNPLRIYPFFDHMLVRLGADVNATEYINSLNTNPRINLAVQKANYQSRITALSNSQGAIINLMALLSLVVGIAAVLSTQLITIIEREREIALLNVLGLTNSRLFAQLLAEAGIITIIAVAIGTVAGRLVAALLWLQIVSDSLFVVSPLFKYTTDLLLASAVALAIFLTVILSFRTITVLNLAERIREE